MDKILFINACVRENSRTLRLAKRVLNNLEGEVETLNLGEEDIKPLCKEALDERLQLIAKKDFSSDIFKYARQFSEADVILIAAPFWDLSFPALLKTYFELITIIDLTLTYENDMPKGLCKGKKVYYVSTSGGEFQEEFGFNYVKAITKNFYGIPEAKLFYAQNVDTYASDVEKILEKAEKEIDDYFRD